MSVLMLLNKLTDDEINRIKVQAVKYSNSDDFIRDYHIELYSWPSKFINKAIHPMWYKHLSDNDLSKIHSVLRAVWEMAMYESKGSGANE